jgi:NAD(P)-dependent dehydrogenase (short-subunit alcohol dehydrogenase family)
VNVAGDHVVIGAGGGTGSAVVHELAGRGVRVRAVTRSGTGDVPDGVHPAAEPLTGRQFLELLFEEARKPPKVAVASRPMIRLGGLFNPLVRELNETLYQFERPFVSDASKFQAAFGPFEPTPHRAAVSRTVDWFRRRYAA